MNIFVFVKQIPVISDIRMNHQTFTVDRSSAGSMMNPADLHAVEAALSLKSVLGGSVTVLTMGDESCDVQLREAIAMGADTAVRITDDAYTGADTLVTAKVLTAAVRRLGPADCIFTGHASLDGATGQTGRKISAMLGIPYLDSACQLEADAGGLTIRQKAGTGYNLWKAPFPLLCSVTEDAAKPRPITLKGKMAAKKAVISVLSNAELNLSEADLHSPSSVEALFPAARQEVGIRIQEKDAKDSARKLADILFEKHLI